MLHRFHAADDHAQEDDVEEGRALHRPLTPIHRRHDQRYRLNTELVQSRILFAVRHFMYRTWHWLRHDPDHARNTRRNRGAIPKQL